MKKNIGVIGLKGLPAFGGAATVGENIISQLKRQYDFTVYSVSSHTSKSYSPEGYKQKVFRKFPLRKFNTFFYYLKSALYCIFKGKHDLIHLHHTDGAFILPILRLKYKVICTSHAQPQINEKWPGYVKVFFRLNEYIALRMASIVTAVSKPLFNIYKNNTRKPLYYIPNGINLEEPIGKEHKIIEDYLLFAAGRIIPLKGLHVLLSSLKESSYGLKLKVIGDLSQMQDYEAKIRNLSQGLNVDFIPIIKEKKKLLAYVEQAKLFIFPSYSENMSIMLLEVALTKTPIICSDIVANKAIFDDSEVLFFKTNDPADLNAKIKYALKNTEELRQRSVKAYKKLEERFNWKTICEEYSNLYSIIIQKSL